MTDELSERVQQRQAERFRILQALYQRWLEDQTDSQVLWLAKDTGIDPNTALIHGQYLQQQEFVTLTFGSADTSKIGLLHAGEVEVERVLSGQWTPNFPVYIQNMINVGNMNRSQIQQGTENSTATLTVTNLTDDHRPSLERLFRNLRESAGQFGLDEQRHAELEDGLTTGESELSRRKPNAGVLREVLKSVRSIFEGAGGALAAQYLPQIGELIRMFGG
jgi:hypothetical protein